MQCEKEVYSEPCQKSKLEKAVKYFSQNSILDVWQGSEYTSVRHTEILIFDQKTSTAWKVSK